MLVGCAIDRREWFSVVILDRLHPSNGALTDETLCSLEMYLMSDDIADEQPADFSGSILLCNHHVGPHGPVGWVCSRQRTAPRNILVADRGSDVIVMIGRTVDRAFAQVYDVVDLERAAPPRHSLDWGTFPDEGARVQPLRELSVRVHDGADQITTVSHVTCRGGLLAFTSCLRYVPILADNRTTC